MCLQGEGGAVQPRGQVVRPRSTLKAVRPRGQKVLRPDGGLQQLPRVAVWPGPAGLHASGLQPPRALEADTGSCSDSGSSSSGSSSDDGGGSGRGRMVDEGGQGVQVCGARNGLPLPRMEPGMELAEEAMLSFYSFFLLFLF